MSAPNIKEHFVFDLFSRGTIFVTSGCLYILSLLLLLLFSTNETFCLQLNEADFRDSLLTLGFSSEQQSFFIKLCESKRDQFREILATLELQEPNYHDLDWRFEIVAASRSLPEQVTPIITLDLQLKMQNAKVKRLLLQTDVVSLVHVTHELEKALNESKGRHCRRIERMLHSHS